MRVRDYNEEFVNGGRPVPVCPPRIDRNHIYAYETMLFKTKEDAILSWQDEGWRDDELVCVCYVQEDGDLDCTKRVARLSSQGVEPINLDEDFLITWSRNEIFSEWEMEDPYAPQVTPNI